MKADRATRLQRKAGYLQGSFLAMGSPCELLVDTTDAGVARRLLDLVAAEAWRIEDKFSRYLADNIVDEINRCDAQPVKVDEETANLIDFCAALHGMTDGRFDITSGVLRKVWTFDGGDRVPRDEDVREVLATVGWHKAAWNRPTLTLAAGQQIDFGGVAKEYAVDRAAGLLLVDTDAACLVNFGGDIYATAAPHRSDGWRVGIDALELAPNTPGKIIRLKHGGLATSGDARRFVLKDGVRYGHILDPMTGWPVRDAPRSISVAADNCTQAGMLATIAMLRGSRAESFLEEQNVRFWSYR